MRYFIVLCFAIFMASCGQKNTSVNAVDSTTTALDTLSYNMDTYFSKLTELDKFNGVVLAYKGDSLVVDKAFNLNPNQDSSTYVTVNSQFDIHSISKLMTYYLVVKLEKGGLLSLNRTLDSFIADFPNGDKITVKMLLEHRSGLPRELIGLEGSEYDLSSDDIVELAKGQPLLFEPGEDVQYSNVGYEILYYIVGKMYGKPFAQCVVDEIFVPFGMDSSGTHFFAKQDRIKNMARNHSLKDGSLQEVDNIQKDEFRTARLFSTAADLKKFIDQIGREPIASALQNKNGVIAKDGGSKGIRAQVYLDLEHDFSFVLLANYDEMPFFKTIEDMVKMMKSETVAFPKEINRKSIAVDDDILQQYVGSYTFADFDGLVLEVRVENNQLGVFQEGEKIASLKAESPTVFFEDPKEAESFEFVKNNSGTYDALMGWKGITVEGKRNQ